MDSGSPATISRVGQHKDDITNGGVGDSTNSADGYLTDLVFVDSFNSDCAIGLEDEGTVTTSHSSMGSLVYQ